MAMTFADLQVYSSDLLDDVNNSYFTLPVLKLRLNRGLKELQKRLISANQSWYSYCVKTSTVVDQANYALPDDFVEILRLERLMQGSGATGRYQQIMPITTNQRDLTPDISGDPFWYYIAQNEIVLKPTPNRVVELHLEYAYLVPDMVNQADVPDCPDQYSEYIAILATRDCLIKDGRPLAPIQSKLDQYEILLKQAAVQRKADAPRMIVKTDSDGW